MFRLYNYDNGNYYVSIFSDGTKVRLPKPYETEYNAKKPESIDICISKKCNIGCPYCHEGATKDGNVFSMKKLILNKFFSKFVNSLNEGTEFAIGGGALSEIPKKEFSKFLLTCLGHDIIVNITINAAELKDKEFRETLYVNSIVLYGIGISYSPLMKKEILEFRDRLRKDATKNNRRKLSNETPEIIIHTIAGITTLNDYKWLAESKFKVLVLGYKDFRRGKSYLEDNPSIYKNIKELSDNFDILRKLPSVSFDTLGTQQLNVKEKISEKEWNQYYMGDDGQFTMYIDLVNNTFAPNSTYKEDKRIAVDSWGDSEEIFKIVKTMN